MTDIITEPGLLSLESIVDIEKSRDFTFTTQKVTPKNRDLWRAMGELRGDIYLREGYVRAEDLDVNGAEYDTFDNHSDHFVAVDEGGAVIGTVRVVNRGEGGLLLPAEKEFECQLPDQTQEISRLIHNPELLATDGFLVSLALMRAALKATAGTSEKIYAVLEGKLYRQLNTHIGIELKDVAEPLVIEKYRNTKNHLVEMEPRLVTSQIYKRDIKTREKLKAHPSMAENILGQPFAPFFERNSAAHGLGRVSLADLTSPNPEQFDRNLGFLSVEQQEKIWHSTIAIAGAGGDGGQLAIGLARNGVRHFKLADPEVFDVENLNRQAGATYATIGHNKAEVVADILRAIGANVEVYPCGITTENVADFVQGTDLIIDETEYTMPQLGVMLARESRKQQTPVLMALNVGFGSYTTSFDPKGMTFEAYLGLDQNKTLDEIEHDDKKVPISKWAPHIPTYGNTDVLMEVAREERSAPTVVQGVYLAAADAGTQAIAHLLSSTSDEWGQRIVWAPHGKSVDVIDGSTIVKLRSLHFNVSVAIAALRTRLGKNKL